MVEISVQSVFHDQSEARKLPKVFRDGRIWLETVSAERIHDSTNFLQNAILSDEPGMAAAIVITPQSLPGYCMCWLRNLAGCTNSNFQTRITTRYSILPPDSKTNKMRKRDSRDAEASTQDTEASQQVPTAKAGLTLKTYEPRSGVCLKYRTDKAAEVGRLVAILGRLGKNMAALPDEPEGAGSPPCKRECG